VDSGRNSHGCCLGNKLPRWGSSWSRCVRTSDSSGGVWCLFSRSLRICWRVLGDSGYVVSRRVSVSSRSVSNLIAVAGFLSRTGADLNVVAGCWNVSFADVFNGLCGFSGLWAFATAACRRGCAAGAVGSGRKPIGCF